MVTVEMSHVQREQTARPLGPDTHLLKCDVIIQSDPPNYASAPGAFS